MVGVEFVWWRRGIVLYDGGGGCGVCVYVVWWSVLVAVV